jgi:hypothetical protein
VKTSHAQPLRSAGLVTTGRIERKYMIEAREAEVLARSLSERLAPHHHDTVLDDAHPPQHFSTTVYFDTPARCVLREAERGGAHCKLRVREYYDVDASPAQPVGGAAVARPTRTSWLELKVRDGDRTCKHRVGVPKAAIAQLFEAGEPRLGLMSGNHHADCQPSDEWRRVLLDWSRRLDGLLQASVVVNYRRKAWQNAAGTVRVTLDEDLAIFRPRPELWELPGAWSRDVLGTAAYREPRCVLEVKCAERTPGWLERALPAAKLEPTTCSKFVRGCRAIGAAGG